LAVALAEQQTSSRRPIFPGKAFAFKPPAGATGQNPRDASIGARIGLVAVGVITGEDTYKQDPVAGCDLPGPPESIRWPGATRNKVTSDENLLCSSRFAPASLESRAATNRMRTRTTARRIDLT